MKLLSRLIGLCLEKQVPFVCYRLPGSKMLHTWIQRSGRMQFFESFDQIGIEPGFVYAPFHRKTNFPVVFFDGEIRIEGDDIGDPLLQDLDEMKPLYEKPHDSIPTETSKPGYIEQAKTYIQSFDKHRSKAVLSRIILRKKPAGFEPGKVLQSLSGAYPDAFVHLIFMPGNGLWAGATPELLYRRENNYCFTEALAGTMAYDGKRKVHWKNKETEEQELVSAYIESLMQTSGIHSYTRGKPTTQPAGNMVHRKTGFRFTTNPSFNEAAFIRALHPTPAVCGLPKEEALDLILRTERHNREYYTGFCGPVNIEGSTNLHVNLRCMKIFDEYLAFFTGGGLTAKSIPEKEWDETELKAGTLLSVI